MKLLTSGGTALRSSLIAALCVCTLDAPFALAGTTNDQDASTGIVKPKAGGGATLDAASGKNAVPAAGSATVPGSAAKTAAGAGLTTAPVKGPTTSTTASTTAVTTAVTTVPVKGPTTASTATSTTAPGKGPTTTPVAKAPTRSHGMAPCLSWINPDVPPKAVLLCVHGLGLQSGAYEAFGKRMADQGIATYAVDVRGFGSWQRAAGRGKVDFQDCLNDVHDTLRLMHKVHPGLPVFLLGESMGGSISLHETAKYPDLVDGLIACVPPVNWFKGNQTQMKVALHLLTQGNKPYNFGNQVIAQSAESNRSQDPAHPNKTDTFNKDLQKGWSNDPLARMTLSPIELLQFQSFMKEDIDCAKAIDRTPVLVVQGWEDNLVKWTGTIELWKDLVTDDKQIELIPHGRHLIFEESQYNDQALNTKVQKMVTRWIDDHLKQPAIAGQTVSAP